MDEYIKRNQALCCFSGWIDQNGDFHEPDEMIEYQRIEQLTAADVVPVVRCKDCIRWHKDPDKNLGWCAAVCSMMSTNMFCSFGLRKDGEQA